MGGLWNRQNWLMDVWLISISELEISAGSDSKRRADYWRVGVEGMATTPAANPKVPVPPDQVLLMLSLPPNNCHNHVCEGCAHKERKRITVLWLVARGDYLLLWYLTKKCWVMGPVKDISCGGKCYITWFMLISNFSPWVSEFVCSSLGYFPIFIKVWCWIEWVDSVAINHAQRRAFLWLLV